MARPAPLEPHCPTSHRPTLHRPATAPPLTTCHTKRPPSPRIRTRFSKPKTNQGERAKDPPKTEKVAPLYGLAAPPLPDRLDNGRIMCMHQPEPKWVAQFVHLPTTLQFIVFRKPISMAVSRWYYVIPSYQKKKEDMVGRGELKKEDFEGPAPTAPTAIKFLRFFLGMDKRKSNMFASFFAGIDYEPQYVAQWAELGSTVPDKPGEWVHRLTKAVNHDNDPKHNTLNFKVLLFERFVESLALVQVSDGGRVRRHATQATRRAAPCHTTPHHATPRHNHHPHHHATSPSPSVPLPHDPRRSTTPQLYLGNMPSAAFSVPPSKHRAHPKPDAWPVEALKWFAAQPEGKAVNALYVWNSKFLIETL